MYECLVGYPPFYADDPMSTCRKIVNWKKTLVFPAETKLSPEAKDLITKMICDASSRITFEQMKKHPFFKGIDWDHLRSAKAPIIPELKSDIDTQHFDEFPDDAADTAAPKAGGAGGGSEFIGFTYKRVAKPKAIAQDFFSAPE